MLGHKQKLLRHMPGCAGAWLRHCSEEVLRLLISLPKSSRLECLGLKKDLDVVKSGSKWPVGSCLSHFATNWEKISVDPRSLGPDWSFGVPHNKKADLGRYTWMLTSLKYYLKNLAQREFIHTTGRAIPVQHLLSQSEMAHGTQW